MSERTALITGITGQDGSYLAEQLLDRGYEVHGIIRRSSSFNTKRIDHIFDRLKIHYGDLSDGSALSRLIGEVQPDEIYNLGAQSHVKVSFDVPEYTGDVTGLGAIRFLEAIREHRGSGIRYYQASSSEMFGATPPPQDENTPFYPRSPYGCAKVYAYWITKNYREAYGLHASNGILFNHESPRRGETFVTRKITRAVARIALGLQEKLILGNLEAKRDWGHAADYTRAMQLMVSADKPGDYVVATGVAVSVRDFLKLAFDFFNLDYQKYVVSDPKYFRPTEVDHLLGDPTKIKTELGWEPRYDLEDLVMEMVKHDYVLAKQELAIKSVR